MDKQNGIDTSDDPLHRPITRQPEKLRTYRAILKLVDSEERTSLTLGEQRRRVAEFLKGRSLTYRCGHAINGRELPITVKYFMEKMAEIARHNHVDKLPGESRCDSLWRVKSKGLNGETLIKYGYNRQPDSETPFPASPEPVHGTVCVVPEKPYHCEVCGKRYGTSNGLKYHRGHAAPCNRELTKRIGSIPGRPNISVSVSDEVHSSTTTLSLDAPPDHPEGSSSNYGNFCRFVDVLLKDIDNNKHLHEEENYKYRDRAQQEKVLRLFVQDYSPIEELQSPGMKWSSRELFNKIREIVQTYKRDKGQRWTRVWQRGSDFLNPEYVEKCRSIAKAYNEEHITSGSDVRAEHHEQRLSSSTTRQKLPHQSLQPMSVSDTSSMGHHAFLKSKEEPPMQRTPNTASSKRTSQEAGLEVNTPLADSPLKRRMSKASPSPARSDTDILDSPHASTDSFVPSVRTVASSPPQRPTGRQVPDPIIIEDLGSTEVFGSSAQRPLRHQSMDIDISDIESKAHCLFVKAKSAVHSLISTQLGLPADFPCPLPYEGRLRGVLMLCFGNEWREVCTQLRHKQICHAVEFTQALVGALLYVHIFQAGLKWPSELWPELGTLQGEDYKGTVRRAVFPALDMEENSARLNSYAQNLARQLVDILSAHLHELCEFASRIEKKEAPSWAPEMLEALWPVVRECLTLKLELLGSEFDHSFFWPEHGAIVESTRMKSATEPIPKRQLEVAFALFPGIDVHSRNVHSPSSNETEAAWRAQVWSRVKL